MLDLLLRRGCWRRCRHHSHRWPHWRTCWRGQVHDYFCADHNQSCWDGNCHYPANHPKGTS